MIGGILATRSRGSAGDQEAGRARSETSNAGRVRKSEAEGTRVEPGRTEEERPAALGSPAEGAQAPPGEQKDAAGAPSSPAPPSSEEPRDDATPPLTLLDQLRTRRNGFEPAVPARPPEEGVRNPADEPAGRVDRAPAGQPSPLAQRLRNLTISLSSARSAAANRSRNAPGPLDALAGENREASASADDARLQDFVQALREDRAAAAAEEGPAQEPSPVAAEEQRQALRSSLQDVAEGLSADAETETRRLREAAPPDRPEVQTQREVQQNRQEIQSLQAERRRAQQEAQRADQAIRQLQSRNARLQSEASRPADASGSLDLLAQ